MLRQQRQRLICMRPLILCELLLLLLNYLDSFDVVRVRSLNPLFVNFKVIFVGFH